MTSLSAKGQTGTIEFDGTFVTIKRGGLARLTVGKGDKRIPVHSITAVQVKPAGALVNGFISFSLAGGVEKQSKFGKQTIDAGADENSVVFTKKQASEFEALRDAVEQAIVAAHAPAAANAAPRSEGMDLTDQLQRLAELHQAGVLTAEEFSQKKADLLSRM